MNKYLKKLFFIFTLLTASVLLNGCAKHQQKFAAYENLSAETIFNNGENALAGKHYGKAIQHFEALDAVYPFGPYTEQAQLDLIYAYYKSGDIASALAASDRYIRLYPRSEHIDYVYYLKGRISEESGYTWLQRHVIRNPAPHDLSTQKQAFMAYSEVVTRFSRSAYAYEATVRMQNIRNVMAAKEIFLAQFYLERNAYMAAANRASEVVQHYNGSPQMIPALAIMVRAYHAAGLTELEENTLRIFQASYPDAPELRNLMKEYHY